MITLTPTLPPVPAIDASQTTSARKLEWPSELPPSEPQGQCERSRLANGSLPVSSAEVFDVIGMIDRQIDLATIDADHPDQHETRRWIKVMRHCNNVLALHASELGREMERATERQPEENVPHHQRALPNGE